MSRCSSKRDKEGDVFSYILVHHGKWLPSTKSVTSISDSLPVGLFACTTDQHVNISVWRILEDTVKVHYDTIMVRDVLDNCFFCVNDFVEKKIH